MSTLRAEPLRVLLITLSPTTTTALTPALTASPAIQIVASVASPAAALALTTPVLPEVALLAVGPELADWLPAVRQLHHARPALPLALAGVQPQHQQIVLAVERGVGGCLTPPFTAPVLLAVLRLVAQGGCALCPPTARAVQQWFYRPLAALSPREQQVIQLVVAGATTAEIAATLAIAPKTVEGHLRRIGERIGTHSRADLVAWWVGRVVDLSAPAAAAAGAD